MTTQPNQPATLTEFVAARRQSIAYGLLVAGVLMLVLTIFWVIRWQTGRDQPAPPPEQAEQQSAAEETPEPKPAGRGDYLPAAIWSGLLALLLFISAGWQLTRKPDQGRLLAETRRWLIAVGGCAGLATAVLGFVLAWRWQTSLSLWINEGETKEAKWLLAALVIFLGGLALAFFSVQLARAEERSSAPLRRLLYGGNAVLTGLLLLLLLTVGNVIAFVKLPDSTITTAAAFRGLSEASREFLHTVKEDINVYLVLPERYVARPPSGGRAYLGLYTDCRALLNAVQVENSRIKVIAYSPATDADEINKMVRRLKVTEELREEFGMFIALARDETINSFVHAGELLSATPQGEAVFQGEHRLMTKLNFLAGGGKRPVVYFTQSNLEPLITGPVEGNDRSCREIVQVLKLREFEVKPLLLEQGRPVDLSDAAVVIIAGPRRRFDPDQVKILRDYLEPKKEGKTPGKLIAFLPAFQNADGNVAETGLEALFADYGIEVQNKRVFSMPRQQIPSDWAYCMVSPILRPRGISPHPLAQRFSPEFQVPLGNLRLISAAERKDYPGFLVRNLFVTSPAYKTFEDRKADSNPDEIDAQIRREGEDSKTAVEKRLGFRLRPIAAFRSKLVRRDEGYTEQPRLAVVGSDWFISDQILRQPQLAPENYARMVLMLLDWMRESPESMRIEPRAVATFTLPKDPDGVSLVILPVALVVLGITALGVGVSVARRK